MDLDRYLTHRREQVEQALEQWLPTAPPAPQRLHAAIRHSLMGGGKRLRPILLLAAAEAVGGDWPKLLPFACALECIHTYSLIHDDLPAMDDDDLRRGRPTCHKQFDEATAILAGDALLTLAFELATRPIPGIDPAILLTVVGQLAMDAGINGMVGGQMLDMLGEGQTLTLDGLKNIHRHKTGALIRVSCLAGARLGGGNAGDARRLKFYGEAIGLAFQIMDDILDETGDSRLMGKATGQDRESDKATYPRLVGLEPARREAEHLVDQALENLLPFGSGAEPLRSLARYILTRTH